MLSDWKEKCRLNARIRNFLDILRIPPSWDAILPQEKSNIESNCLYILIVILVASSKLYAHMHGIMHI